MRADDLIGGRYRLVGLLGRGGSSDVWRAVDERLGRDVAVKVLRTDVSAEDRARSAGEARLLASLSHPNLVAILDVSQLLDSLQQDEGVSVDDHLVLELVPGGSLADSLARGPLSTERARAVVADVAAALDYLHRRGVIHRDVKPANVLFAADGRAKLTDFGIARVLGAESVTRTGLVMGTAAYLSPEQVRGASPTRASDTYALGLVLLECLTGTREFPGTPAESAIARLQRTPVVPDHLDPALADLVRAMVATEPADRPAMAAVEGVLRDRTALAAAPAVPELAETGPLAVAPARLGSTPPTAVLPIPARRRHRRLALLLVPVPVAAAVAGLLLSSGGAGAAPPKPDTTSAVGSPTASATPSAIAASAGAGASAAQVVAQQATVSRAVTGAAAPAAGSVARPPAAAAKVPGPAAPNGKATKPAKQKGKAAG